MEEFKLIVAGGRNFNNYELLSRTLFALADVEYADKMVSIVSGKAKGADALGYHFAVQNLVKVYEYPADWTLGRHAGFVRNVQMSCAADGLVAFWDGQSRGTAHMIECMQKIGKPVTIIRY